MAKHITGKLNSLERTLPEGLLVDAKWLSRFGYSTSLRSQYVAAGWLERPARRVYRRRRGQLVWQQVVVSLQALLDHILVIGGRSALELQGYAHYLRQRQTEVHLYGPKPPPSWLDTLPLEERFVFHNSIPLFGVDLASVRLPRLDDNGQPIKDDQRLLSDAGYQVTSWGAPAWPLVQSTPERALLELLDELPSRESFHHVDLLVEGLDTLSPRRLQKLLINCRSVKVKRLFFFFSDRHKHAWLKRLDRQLIDLGVGKRMLVRGGRFDPVHQITVPEDLRDIQ